MKYKVKITKNKINLEHKRLMIRFREVTYFSW